MKSTQTKIEYSKQFENIIKGVEDSLRKQENVLSQRDQKVEDLKQVYQNVRNILYCIFMHKHIV